MNATPKFPLSVPRSLWDQCAHDLSPAFADSWLYGATLRGDTLIPRTQTCWLKFQSGEPKAFLQRLKLTLDKPPPFHMSGRSSAREELGLPERRK